VALPDEDALAERYVIAEERLTAAGLEWYEVSSWAAGEDARCRHNIGYWRGDDWLGIGPGAHAHIGGHRWANVRRPAEWAARVQAGERPVETSEALGPAQRDLERMITEVRTRAGLPVSGAAGERAAALARDGLLDAGALAGGRAVLTLRGRQVADLVTRELALAG
jgi:oxygen-independent coproporphyrinogen-3 oxidase